MTEEQIKEFENKCEFIEGELRALPKISFNMRRHTHIDLKGDLKDWTDILINTYCLLLDTYEVKGRDEHGQAITEKVCDKERHRSADDLYRITIAYKPGVKFIDFIEALFMLGLEGKIRSLFCGDIKRRTYYPKIDTFYGSDFPTFTFTGYEYTDKREEYNFNFRLLIAHYADKAKSTKRIPAEA